MNQKCTNCEDTNFIKLGKRYNRAKTYWRQRYYCRGCHHRFTGTKNHPIPKKEFEYQSQAIPPQNWSAYTKAQNEHKQGTIDILQEMLGMIKVKQVRTPGRPNACLKDITFALTLKTFTGLSSRRLHSELEIMRQLGYIEKTPHFTVLMKYLSTNDITIILKELIKLSALPIKQASSGTFSVDATGFSSSQFGRWYDHKWGREITRRHWVKCHAMVENTTNTVVNVEVTDGTAGDSPRFEKLVTETNQDFEIKEVSADKAYSSIKNLEIVSRIGGEPFIPFKKNALGKKKGSLIWRKTFDYMKNRPQEFFQHYHRRSNVETSFAMVKQKFGGSLASKTFVSQQNEVLLKILCHNISCLLHEFYEKKIENYLTTHIPNIQIIQKSG